MLLERPLDAARLEGALRRSPAVVLVGPRQAGKSTLARAVVAPDAGAFFDLEDPRGLARLGEPTLSLSGRPGTVVLDEAQRSPDVFPALRVLIDEDRRPGRFLVLGSASPDLIGMASESLAGRVEILELPGFRAQDVGGAGFDELWRRGPLPPAFTASDTETSTRWREATHAGAELDLRLEMAGRRIGVEIKRTDRPAITPSIRNALADLELDHVYIVHAGVAPRFQLSPRVSAVPARELLLTGPAALSSSPL